MIRKIWWEEFQNFEFLNPHWGLIQQNLTQMFQENGQAPSKL